MICIANYLFDSLKHDVFQCQSPQLREGLVELRANVIDALDPTNPAILDRLVPKWTFQSLEPVTVSASSSPTSSSAAGATFDCYPSEPAWNQVVQYYTDAGHDSTFLIPVGAFRCIQRFLHMSHSNLLVISGDKGYSHPEAFHSLDPPHLAVHGSFSFMVNYHAVQLLMRALCPNTSVALNTTQHEGSLKITALIACRTSSGTIERDFGSTIQSYRTRIDEFGPSDFFFVSQSVKDVPSPSIRHIVATIKLSCHDAEVFFRLSDCILEKIDEQIDLINLDIVGIMERVWRNYFRINVANDVPFEMGRICFGLGMYKPALEHYANSHCVIGSNHVTYYNIGIVLYELGDFAAAERLLLKSLQLDTNYDRSLTWLAKTREELQRRRQNALPLVELNAMVARTAAQAVELRDHIDTQLRRVLPQY